MKTIKEWALSALVFFAFMAIFCGLPVLFSYYVENGAQYIYYMVIFILVVIIIAIIKSIVFK